MGAMHHIFGCDWRTQNDNNSRGIHSKHPDDTTIIKLVIKRNTDIKLKTATLFFFSFLLTVHQTQHICVCLHLALIVGWKMRPRLARKFSSQFSLNELQRPFFPLGHYYLFWHSMLAARTISKINQPNHMDINRIKTFQNSISCLGFQSRSIHWPCSTDWWQCRYSRLLTTASEFVLPLDYFLLTWLLSATSIQMGTRKTQSLGRNL